MSAPATLTADAPATDTAARPAPAADPPPDPHPQPRCANCGAPLGGPWCSACGQSAAHLPHTLTELLAEALEGLTHADSRLWRTIGALLLHPGQLTREYRAGRRARYLPPVRLYLVLSVLYFGASGLATEHPEAPAPLLHTGPVQVGVNVTDCAIHYDGPGAHVLIPRLQHACERIRADNGRALLAGMQHNLPKALFVLLPVFAGLMALLYWRPRRTYVEHLLFCIHTHAFFFLVFGVLELLTLLPVSTVALRPLRAAAFLGWLPVYLYLALRRVYAQPPRRTLLKFGVLGILYCICVALTLAGTALFSAATL